MTTVITGGSRGIGAAAVEQFAARGDRVFFLYEKEHEAARAVAEKTGATPICCDVADSAAVKSAFAQIYNYLSKAEDDEKYHYVMVGYRLGNTVTENGHVSRGCCNIDDQGYLIDVTERTMIKVLEDGTAYSEDEGATWTKISPETVVSMNMWGFSNSFMKELEARFPAFLEENLPKNPMKCEYFLPLVVTLLLNEDKADVTVLKSEDKWYGVTYAEDKPSVVEALAGMRKNGLYPEKVWSE